MICGTRDFKWRRRRRASALHFANFAKSFAAFAVKFSNLPDDPSTYIVIRYNHFVSSNSTSYEAGSPDYEVLAELRYQIRRFLHFSEEAARRAGLEPQQHQLMLALKGLPGAVRPRIGELAERLQIQHHSAVELVNRLSAAGFVRRRRSGEDRREVLLLLTPKGEKVLHELSVHHKSELKTQGPALAVALFRAMGTKPSQLSDRTGKKGKLDVRTEE